jgi:hypothetical protein
MASTTETKRSRGDRKANPYPKAGVCYVIVEVGPQGKILEPKKYIAKFRNVIGVKVRDMLNPTIPNWKYYPEEKKRDLWDEHLVKNFRFPEGTHELVKHRAFLDDGTILPTLEDETEHKVYPKGVNFLPLVWQHNSYSMALLVDEKTSPAALAKSGQNREQAKKN